MAYDTSVRSPPVFRDLVARWTRELIATLPGPAAGGCEWLMGVPTYDDDKEYHRPDVHSLAEILAGLSGVKVSGHFRGVAIYAAFTTDARKWATFDRVWRGKMPVKLPPSDPRNTTE
jgi:hypothetical protein